MVERSLGVVGVRLKVKLAAWLFGCKGCGWPGSLLGIVLFGGGCRGGDRFDAVAACWLLPCLYFSLVAAMVIPVGGFLFAIVGNDVEDGVGRPGQRAMVPDSPFAWVRVPWFGVSELAPSVCFH